MYERDRAVAKHAVVCKEFYLKPVSSNEWNMSAAGGGTLTTVRETNFVEREPRPA